MSGRYSLDYVKEHYGVPVKRGLRVTAYDGRRGVVTAGDGQYVRVRLDGEKHSFRYHPFDLEYGDGITKEQRVEQRNKGIEIWNDRLNNRITADEYREQMTAALSPLVAKGKSADA